MLAYLLMAQYWELSSPAVSGCNEPGAYLSDLCAAMFIAGFSESWEKRFVLHVSCVPSSPYCYRLPCSHGLEVQIAPFLQHKMVSGLDIVLYFSEFDIHWYACFCVLLSIAVR